MLVAIPLDEADVQVFVTALGALAGVAAIAAFVLDALNAARQRETRLRRPAGWFIAVVALTTVAGCVWWLLAQGVPVQEWPRHRVARFGGFALLVTAVATFVAVRTPLVGYQHLHYIARETAECVRIDRVPQAVYPIRGYRRIVRWSAAPLTVVEGPRGSGKTFNVGLLVAKLCQQVVRQRRPRHVAIWVNAATVETVDAITTDLVAAHVARAGAFGNTAAAEYLADRMRTDRGRVRWLIVIDSIDDLPLGDRHSDREAALLAYLDRVREFARARVHVRVVALMVAKPNPLPTDIPVCPAEPLTDHQFRELLGTVGQPELIARLRFDPYLREIRASPLLVRMLGPVLSEGGPLPGSYDLMARIVAARLTLFCGDADEHVAVEHAASELAWMMAETGDEHAVVPPDDHHHAILLVRAGLGRMVGEAFRFSHPCFQRYFGARLFVEEQRQPDLSWALESPVRVDMLVTVLHSRAAEPRSRIIEDAVSILEEEKAANPALPNALTVTEPAVVGPGSVRWPEPAGTVMTLLRHGLCPTPGSLLGEPAISEPASRMVRAAMAGGTGLTRTHALELLPLAAPGVAADVTRLILVDQEDPELVEPLFEQLAWLPDVTAQLDPAVLAGEFVHGNGYRMLNTLRHAPPTAREPHSMPWRMHSVLKVGTISAFGLMAFTLLSLITAWSTPKAVFLAIAWLIAAGFLADARVRADTGISHRAYGYGATLLVITVFIGFLAVIATVVSLFSGVPLAALRAAVTSYLMTWPVSMIGTVLLGKPATPADWLLPQVRLARRQLLPWLAEQIRPAWSKPEIRSLLTAPAFLLPVVFAVLCAIIAVFNMPAVSSPVEVWVDVTLAAVAGTLIAIPAWRLWLRLRRDRSGLAGALTGAIPTDIDNAWMLEMLDHAADRSAAQLPELLRRLSDLDSAALVKVTAALDDLYTAMEFTRNVLPPGIQAPIPPAVLKSTLAGPFIQPQFHSWLTDFDLRHPGVLSWLANNHRDLVTTLVHRAQQRNR